ncbi:MAG: hypothetical protein PHD15_05495 [Clostridia bacterium]|nr:hypothetical protein [Clostridia bacterium]MDD4387187.1 hypothetical protein [Clostridia bacterium]
MNIKFISKTLITIVFLITVSPNIYGISDNFKFVIDTIGIPRYNVYLEEINEDIYNAYNVFVYSNPQGLLWHNEQRFKSVENLGKWTRYNGLYRGIGERGEYYLLGSSYSGSVISNVYFPADFLPETTPDKWIYLVTNNAYESWFNKGIYKYEEQLEYMKNADLLFDQIDYNAGTINSYNLVSYNISVNKIGMNKMTLNTASTWKTNGIITARRLTNLSQIRNAIFATAPMSANADILSSIIVDDKFVIKSNEDKIIIPITISGEAINLSNYAKEKHIKEITSILYINNKEITRVSGSKTVKVDKNILFTVSRENYQIPNTYPIDIKVKSYLYTEFSIDGLMQHEIKKRINVQVIEKEVIPINNIKLSVLEKSDNNLVVRPLVKTLNTTNSDSEGIIEAGKYLAIRLDKNIDILNVKCYINNIETDYQQIYTGDKYIVLKICIDEKLSNTIKSWNYLREKTKNYFDIKFSEIGERISNPNILKIIYNSNYTKLLKFDSIDKYSNNINFSFENNVLNSEEIKNSISIEDWIIDE